jgi:hypothetical protein
MADVYDDETLGLAIATDIPVPAVEGKSGPRRKYPFSVLEPGHSFFVPCPEGFAPGALQNRVNAAAQHYRKAYARNTKFVTRQFPDGVRCWRSQ